jgi:hypothetical protein
MTDTRPHRRTVFVTMSVMITAVAVAVASVFVLVLVRHLRSFEATMLPQRYKTFIDAKLLQ